MKLELDIPPLLTIWATCFIFATQKYFFVAYIFHCLFSSVEIGFVITLIPFKVFMMTKLTPESSYETVATLPEN